jgi:hypothetical protein
MSFLSDQKYPKSYNTKGYPILATKTSDLLTRIEPILTPKKLVSRYLKGLDLSDYSNDDLKDKIMLAINEVEITLNTTLTPTIRKEKHPFDRSLYQQFIHIMTNFGPILQIEKLCIQSSNDKNIFTIPADWIEAARFYQRQINVIPLTVVGATGITQGQPTGAAGLVFIAAMSGGLGWVPSYWEVEYMTGLCHKEGHLPIIVNDLIGCIAAIEILGNLGPLNANTSISVSHDGISQSSSNPGPALYQTRIGELSARKNELIKQLKKITRNHMFVSNI